MRGQTLMAAAVSTMVMLGVADRSSAAISLDLTPVDNTAWLSGYATYDLQVTTDTDWTAAAGLLELTAGSLYQHAQGVDHFAPHALQLSASPALAFDTYVVGSIAGGAGDIEGTEFAFNDSRLDVTWFNTTSADIGTMTIGRVTMTDDAAGEMSLLVSSADEMVEYDVTFSPGVSPMLTQIIKAVEQKSKIWESPTILPRPESWASPDSLYGYNAALINMWLPPSDLASSRYRPFEASSIATRWDYNSVYIDRPGRATRALMDDGHQATTNLLYFEPKPTALSQPDLPSLLPEPGVLVLTGLGLGAVVLRRR